MRKKILFTSISILIFLSLFISYLSIFGIKTNNFNNLISKKIKEYDSKLTIEIEGRPPIIISLVAEKNIRKVNPFLKIIAAGKYLLFGTSLDEK